MGSNATELDGKRDQRDERGPAARRRWCGALALTLIVATASAAESQHDIVRLSTGESLRVEVLSIDDDLVTFKHPALGTMTVPRSAVLEITRIDLDAPPPAAAVPAEPATDITAPAPPPPPAAPAATPAAPEEPAADPRRWRFRLTLAGGGAAGNTENTNFVLRLAANRETDESRTTADASYFYGSSDGDKSENRFSSGVRHDWLLPESRWFFFAFGRYDYDEFQSWLHRAQGFGGVGYRLIEPPKFALDALGGLGVLKEWRSQNDDPRMEGLLGLEGALDIAENHRFVFASTVFPDLTEDLGEFRWVNSAGWKWRFNSKSPLALSAGLEHEYQSQVDPGRDRNDIRIFAGVDWEF